MRFKVTRIRQKKQSTKTRVFHFKAVTSVHKPAAGESCSNEPGDCSLGQRERGELEIYVNIFSKKEGKVGIFQIHYYFY